MFVLIIISVNCEVILAYNSGINFHWRRDLISFKLLSTSNLNFRRVCLKFKMLVDKF